jgi:hypothetical protein
LDFDAKPPLFSLTGRDRERTSRHGTDSFAAGLNSNQSTMCNFSAAAVAAAYLKVLSDCGGNRAFHAI